MLFDYHRFIKFNLLKSKKITNPFFQGLFCFKNDVTLSKQTNKQTNKNKQSDIMPLISES